VNLSGDLDVLAGLGLLIDKSLVRANERGQETRYRLLETIREFAQEALNAAGEREAVQDRHAAHFLALAERGARELERPQQRIWLGLLEDEHPNFRQSFATMEERKDSAGFVRLANALSFFWFCHAHTREGAQRLEQALALERGGTLTRARMLAGGAVVGYAIGAYGKALVWLVESEALARALGDNSLLSYVMLVQGLVAERLGDEANATFCFEEALDLAQRANSAWLSALALPNLSDAAYRRGNLDLAEQYAQAANHVIRESGNAYMECLNLANVAQVALARGEHHGAADAYLRALVIAQEIDTLWNVANGILGAAAVSAALGSDEQAARLLGAADAAREASGHPRLPQFGLHDQTTKLVDAKMGADAFRAAWEAGRALALEDAVGEARGALHGAVVQEFDSS
jgi:tetratricopeptide (TPR) repeat protein